MYGDIYYYYLGKFCPYSRKINKTKTMLYRRANNDCSVYIIYLLFLITVQRFIEQDKNWIETINARSQLNIYYFIFNKRYWTLMATRIYTVLSNKIPYLLSYSPRYTIMATIEKINDHILYLIYYIILLSWRPPLRVSQ